MELGAAVPPPGTFGSLADTMQSIMTGCHLSVDRPRAAGVPRLWSQRTYLGFGPTWASQQLPDLGKLLMLFQPQFFIFTKGIR